MDPKHVINLSDPDARRVVKEMMKGDPGCRHKLEDVVFKWIGEKGDLTPLMHRGVVKGSLLFQGDELYLVQFDGFEAPTFITGQKLI